jgi:hypothetical protein
MIAGRMRLRLVQIIGATGLLALSACGTSEPYGARSDENGYSYTHRQHGLYNDAQYRYRSRYDDDDDYRYGYYRYSYAPPVQYNYYYYDDGYRRYGYRPAYRSYYYDDDYVYDDDDYVRYGYRDAVYDEDGDLIYYRNRHRD